MGASACQTTVTSGGLARHRLGRLGADAQDGELVPQLGAHRGDLRVLCGRRWPVGRSDNPERRHSTEKYQCRRDSPPRAPGCTRRKTQQPIAAQRQDQQQRQRRRGGEEVASLRGRRDAHEADPGECQQPQPQDQQPAAGPAPVERRTVPPGQRNQPARNMQQQTQRQPDLQYAEGAVHPRRIGHVKPAKEPQKERSRLPNSAMIVPQPAGITRSRMLACQTFHARGSR